MKLATGIITLIVLLFSSCKKETMDLAENDYLVFGHFYGECMGEGCVEIFRIESDKLLEDTKDTYPGSIDFYKANYKSLSVEDFQNTQDLVSYFPNDLLTEKNTVIGQPDAGDWGGIYIEYNYKGIHKFWLIDKMKSNVPDKYYNFIDKVEEKISKLQNTTSP